MGMKKYVIYTILTGGYDDILQPLVIDVRFDYVLFSNDFKEENIGVWQVRPIPIPPEIKPNDNQRLSRYPKMHPETLLAEYEASLYHDANIQITDQWVYERFVELIDKNVDYAGMQLSVLATEYNKTPRDDVYEHAYDMCMRGVIHDTEAIKECNTLYKNGFPEHFGLNENGIIFRRHNERMQQVDEMWWWWIVNYTKRDQLCYMYCLWENNIPLVYFLPPGENLYNTSHLCIQHHDNKEVVKSRKFIKDYRFFEKIRLKTRGMNQSTYDYFLRQWVWIIKRRNPLIWNFLLGIIFGFIYAPRKISRMIKIRI